MGEGHLVNARRQQQVRVSYSYEEVDCEEDVEDQVDLLSCAFRPFVARLHRLPAAFPFAHEK